MPEVPNEASVRRRRKVLRYLLAIGGSAPLAVARGQDAGADDDDVRNPLLWALAWKQTAAEFHALCYQAYNLARLQLDRALAEQRDSDLPLAIITDVDDTVLHAGDYWSRLVDEGQGFFDDALWDAWIPRNKATVVPGSLEFCRYCASRGVAVFYVTSRDQGERTADYAQAQLAELDFPFADHEHLVVLRTTSDKSPAREEIMRRYRVPFLIGDNLNDYRRDYYVTDVAERMALMERDQADYGQRFILLPNPTDGHWVRAIFGESEPPATDANRRRLHAAAMGRSR